MSHHEGHAFRPHYLLAVDPKQLIESVYKYSSVPEWVEEQVRTTPFVVVRRGLATEQEIPIGVRGKERNQRWAASCNPALVKSIITPSQLLTRPISTSRANATPAFRTFRPSQRALDGPRSSWGPGGSIGFELATGSHVVKPESDLDIVIYAERRMTADEAKSLCARAMDLPATVDIRVETPVFGFSLGNSLARAPDGDPLRAPSGVILGRDPWGDELMIKDPTYAAVRRSRYI